MLISQMESCGCRSIGTRAQRALLNADIDLHRVKVANDVTYKR